VLTYLGLYLVGACVLALFVGRFMAVGRGN